MSYRRRHRDKRPALYRQLRELYLRIPFNKAILHDCSRTHKKIIYMVSCSLLLLQRLISNTPGDNFNNIFRGQRSTTSHTGEAGGGAYQRCPKVAYFRNMSVTSVITIDMPLSTVQGRQWWQKLNLLRERWIAPGLPLFSLQRNVACKHQRKPFPTLTTTIAPLNIMRKYDANKIAWENRWRTTWLCMTVACLGRCGQLYTPLLLLLASLLFCSRASGECHIPVRVSSSSYSFPLLLGALVLRPRVWETTPKCRSKKGITPYSTLFGCM